MSLFRTPHKVAGENPRSKRSRLSGCVGVGCGLPLLTYLSLGLMYWLNNRPPNIHVPTPPPPPNNAYDDFVRAANSAHAIQNKNPLSLLDSSSSAERLNVATTYTKEAAPALAVLNEGLSKPCQAPTMRSFAVTDTGFVAFQELVNTLSGVEFYYELSGQPDKAMETILDGEEMVVMLPHGGAMMNLDAAIALDIAALDEFENVLPQLSSAEMAHVADRLDRIAAKRVSYADVVQEEGNRCVAGWQEALKNPTQAGIKTGYDLVQSMIDPPGSVDNKWGERREVLSFTFGSKAAMIREMQEYFKKVAQEVHTPYHGPTRVRVPDNRIAQECGVMDDMRIFFLHRQAVFDMLRVKTALYRHRTATGHFPNTLSQMVPTYLKAVPDDPFGGAVGKTFRYEVREGGKSFLLYSLGSDLMDNGGQPIPSGAFSPGDIPVGPFGHPRKKP